MFLLLFFLLHLVTLLAVNAASLSGLGASFCFLKPNNGQVFCFGSNYFGQFGLGAAQQSQYSSPVKMPGVTTAVDLAHGWGHVCIVEKAGAALCTGLNEQGQLGDESTTNRLRLTPVKSLTNGVAHIFAGTYSHTCALLVSGGLRCWGNGEHGQLGNGGKTFTSSSPTPVQGFENGGVLTAALGDSHTCLITKTGVVYCTGNNASGQLGIGVAISQTSVMTQVQGLTAKSLKIACGEDHTCAVSEHGRVQCWGSNIFGQLGVGAAFPAFSHVPLQPVGLDSGVNMISCGFSSTYAVLVSTGAVKMFGKAQSVLGGTTNQVDNLPGNKMGVTQVVGENTICIVAEQAVQCVGADNYGQLGNHTPLQTSTVWVTAMEISLGKQPTLRPSKKPTQAPSKKPTKRPTAKPTTRAPTTKPTKPTKRPTAVPTVRPTASPTQEPTMPTSEPTVLPTSQPTVPTRLPTQQPTKKQTKSPTSKPTKKQTSYPTKRAG